MIILQVLVFITAVPLAAFVSFAFTWFAMTPSGDHEVSRMRSERLMTGRDVLGFAIVSAAYVYWRGLEVPTVDMGDIFNGTFESALILASATVVAMLVVIVLAGPYRTDALRRCGVVALAVFPVLLVFVVFVSVQSPTDIGVGRGAWTITITMALQMSWLTMMLAGTYFAARHKFRIAEAPPGVLPLAICGTAAVALIRSFINVAQFGLVDDFPTLVGVGFAFAGPISIIALITYYDLRPLKASNGWAAHASPH